jgi:hypothetical protein
MQPEKRKWCLQEKYNHKLDKEFDSPNAPNDTKTSRLRYAGHMIRRPEDLPQKALFRSQTHWKEKSRKTEIQADGVNSDSLALGVRDWTHCAQDKQSWKDFLQQA